MKPEHHKKLPPPELPGEDKGFHFSKKKKRKLRRRILILFLLFSWAIVNEFSLLEHMETFIDGHKNLIPETKYAIVIHDQTPYRKEPDRDAVAVGHIAEGKKIRLIKFHENWAQVKSEARYGWVPKRDLFLEKNN